MVLARATKERPEAVRLTMKMLDEITAPPWKPMTTLSDAHRQDPRTPDARGFPDSWDAWVNWGFPKSPETADSLCETQKTVTANCLLSPNRAFYVECSQNSTFERKIEDLGSVRGGEAPTPTSLRGAASSRSCKLHPSLGRPEGLLCS